MEIGDQPVAVRIRPFFQRLVKLLPAIERIISTGLNVVVSLANSLRINRETEPLRLAMTGRQSKRK